MNDWCKDPAATKKVGAHGREMMILPGGMSECYLHTWYGMFSRTPFNRDISGWNVRKVTNMRSMFKKISFNRDISGWNVSSVTDKSWMFIETPFNVNISRWDVSNVRIIVIFKRLK